MDEETKKHLISMLKSPVSPVKKPILFRLLGFVVLCLMILLPIIYCVLVLGAGYAVYYHAANHYKILQMPQSGVTIIWLRILIYFGPIIIGGLLVIYMIIPLVPRFRRRQDIPLCSITPLVAPDLCMLIKVICKVVNAPYPKRIDLTIEPNASAHFRSGFLSLFRRKDLVLTIGLPLLASLNVRQLAGIIAHEMGHFSQGTAMRLSYLIEGIHMWFLKAVYGRDSFTEKIEAFEEESNNSVALIAILSRLFIELTRLILLLFTMLSFAISRSMSRQMEYDADSYQAQMSGSRVFESTFYALLLLDHSWAQTFYASMASWRDRILCNDLPKLVKHFAKSAIGKKDQDIINETLTKNTTLFDTHPSMRDRIARARMKKFEGICRSKFPARKLLPEFEKLSKQLTRRFYQLSFETQIPENMLIPLTEYVQSVRKYEYELS